jgi:hypothetical protein
MKFTIAAATLASAAAGTGVCVDENCSCADVGADGHLNTGPLTELKVKQFFKCAELTSVDMPEVTYIGPASFKECPDLTSVDMPELTKVGHDAFSRTGLTTVNMPKVTFLGIHGNVFANCPDLTTVNIPEVTKTGRGTFRNCPKLTTVNMPKATKIKGFAFFECTALATVDMPEVTTIENSAFRGTALTAAYAPKATSIGYDSFPAGTVMANAPASAAAGTCPADCNSWYDGCNACTCNNGVLSACTKRSRCLRPGAYGEPMCLDIFDHTRTLAPTNAPTNNASLLDVDECDKTTCSLVENSAGYTVIQVIHPANNDFETVCNDGQDYSKGAQNVAHTTAITKHCAMVGAECKCYKAGSHPNGAVPADVATAPAGWSGSSGTGTATSMDHSGRAGIEAALAAHETINKVTETDTAAANAIKVAAHTRDGTDYAAHDGHVN